MFESVLSNPSKASEIMLCFFVALVCGLILSGFYIIKNKKYSKSMFMTLIVLPAIIQAMIILINGNLGTSIAVLGTFSLVRFRSAQGSSKDMTFVFLAMTIGIATGLGQVVFALLLTVLICVITLILKYIPLGEERATSEIHLKIVLPDDVSFKEEFNPIFNKYAKSFEVLSIKTSQLGSLFTVEYNITLKEKDTEKELIDELRVKNSNLPIVCNSMKHLNESNDKTL